MFQLTFQVVREAGSSPYPLYKYGYYSDADSDGEYIVTIKYVIVNILYDLSVLFICSQLICMFVDS